MSVPHPRRIAALTAELVAVPSHEREAEAQEVVARRLGAAGFECRLQEIFPGRPNLLARRGDGGPFLCTHVDVHPPHAHSEPFTCREEDGLLVGRGVLDAKGQLAALVAAAEAAPGAPARVLVTCDEESGGKGSELADLSFLGPPGEGIVLEPTSLLPCTAQTGSVDLRLRAAGRAAHAYEPEEGVSAYEVLLGAFEALDGCSFLSARHPLLRPPGRTVGLVRAGEHLWRVPARAEAEVALTLLPGIDHEAARAEVEEVLGALGAAWGRAGVELGWEVLDTSEAVDVGEDLDLLRSLRAAAGEDLPAAGMPSWTDAGNLLVHHGIPCVVFGAGHLGPAHSDREWVRLDDLVRLGGILRQLLRGPVSP